MGLAWVLGALAALVLALYLVLLVTPIRLPLSGDAVRAVVQSALPPDTHLEMGSLALALEGGVWPVLHFSPVVLTDTLSGARIGMDGLKLGFSPVRALVGQPAASVTIVAPHLQIVQDLHGPRTASFEVVEDPQGGVPTVRVLEGETAYPLVGISAEGIGAGTQEVPLRSDNDWLIHNLESSNRSLQALVEQAAQGRFSKLVIRDGTIDMSDSVYQLFRRFEDVRLEIATHVDGKDVSGVFSARIGGRRVSGTLERLSTPDGGTRLKFDTTNLDFAAFLPFIDDAQSVAALRGAGALSLDIGFTPEGRVSEGLFRVDLTGIDLRVGQDYFPVASSIMRIAWDPEKSQFALADSAIRIGQSTARVSGVFGLGLDANFGPTIAISLHARDVALHPNDMAPPEKPFETLDFSGWSAPLYGAVGIDRVVARKGEAVIEAQGRIDTLREGPGVTMAIAGKGVLADDLKRIWPYVLGGDSRDWFVANVAQGRVVEARLDFDFPVASLALDGTQRPIPEGGMQIDLLGENVAIRVLPGLAPIAIDGLARLRIDDGKAIISAAGATVPTAKGAIAITNPAVVFDNTTPSESIMEISGRLGAPVSALLALVETQDSAFLSSEFLEQVDLPFEPAAITGAVELGLVATIALPEHARGRALDIDYTINGSLSDLASADPIMERRIDTGQLRFSASQEGYQVAGSARIDGLEADISASGTLNGPPEIRLGTVLRIEDLATMGFDASAFLGGSLRILAVPQAEGAIDITLDLAETALNFEDIGIAKPVGVPGRLTARLRPQGEVFQLENIDLAFGSVRLAGTLAVHPRQGVLSADFDKFALSPGDDAQIALSPLESGGYGVRLRGAQFDLKPVLKRFFGLSQGSGGVHTTQLDQTLALDVQLDRAIGYYATTAFNVALDLLLRGSDLERATLSSQFGQDNAISIATNPAPRGRTMSVAFNDAGTILRFLGIYSQLAGGRGNLVLTTDRQAMTETGQLIMRDFAIVDENNVAQILGNHSDSRAVIAAGNRLDFDAAQVDFVRGKDRVEVGNAVLAGDVVGGTLRGFIYTDRRHYDLVGTYVPLFGLNNAFQKIPLLGPLLGGRDGEGLVGVTFAVRGPLDNPQFTINPLSVLAPGVFRELFEFRARELPPAPQ